MPIILSREIAALSGRPMQAMQAATALKHAALQRDNADAIVAGGAIASLVKLLKPGVRAELQDEAAAVLRALCVGSASTRTAICTAAGAVPYLVLLLRSSTAVRLRRRDPHRLLRSVAAGWGGGRHWARGGRSSPRVQEGCRRRRRAWGRIVVVVFFVFHAEPRFGAQPHGRLSHAHGY